MVKTNREGPAIFCVKVWHFVFPSIQPNLLYGQTGCSNNSLFSSLQVKVVWIGAVCESKSGLKSFQNKSRIKALEVNCKSFRSSIYKIKKQVLSINKHPRYVVIYGLSVANFYTFVVLSWVKSNCIPSLKSCGSDMKWSCCLWGYCSIQNSRGNLPQQTWAL